jgi:NADP-dependent 3-hydroxy acid dehydrogenase YdfG
MRSLENSVAWVTGAGGGIGRAGAAALAAAGSKVVLSARGSEALDEVAGQIAEAGGQAVVEPIDVTDADAVHDLADKISGNLGRIDILVNSAGINVTNRHWPTLDAAAWKAVVDINLTGAFNVTHAVLPHMRARGDGLIINVSSWAGRYDTYLTGPAYNASKHGVLSMSAHLNIEEGKNGIRACTISPGEVNTPFLSKRPVPVPDEEKARMLQEADMGETILFVARMPPHVCINEILISPTWNRLAMVQAEG